jgi:drug/metabolite transporter (DMT)-like permease
VSIKQSHLVMGAVGISIVSWASSFAAIRVALEGYTPGHLALLRFIIGSLALLIYALLVRMPLPALRDVPALALLGFTGFTVYHVAQNAGLQSVSAGAASFLNAAVPIFSALLALIFLRERLNSWGWLGIAISFAGVALISINTGDGLRFEAGAVLILIGAVSESAYFVLQKPFLARYSSLQLTTFTMWAGTLFMLIYAPGLVEQIQAAPLDTTLSIGFLGIFPTAIGYVLWSYALSRVAVSTVTGSMNVLPILTLLIAWVWLGEVPPALSLVGGAATIAGVILLNASSKASQLGAQRKTDKMNGSVDHWQLG